MKVRIRATGEIINIAEYAKVTLDKCDSYGDPIELPFDEVEVINQPTMEELEVSHTIFIQPSDMPSEKRMKFEICKCVISSLEVHSESTIESDCKLALDISNEMMKQWKEREEKE